MEAYRALIVCAVQGDYIEWDDPMREPEAGACPFGECDCVPVVYVRGDVHRGAVEVIERYARHDDQCRSQRVLGQGPCNCGYEAARDAVFGGR